MRLELLNSDDRVSLKVDRKSGNSTFIAIQEKETRVLQKKRKSFSHFGESHLARMLVVASKLYAAVYRNRTQPREQNHKLIRIESVTSRNTTAWYCEILSVSIWRNCVSLKTFRQHRKGANAGEKKSCLLQTPKSIENLRAKRARTENCCVFLSENEVEKNISYRSNFRSLAVTQRRTSEKKFS